MSREVDIYFLGADIDASPSSLKKRHYEKGTLVERPLISAFERSIGALVLLLLERAELVMRTFLACAPVLASCATAFVVHVPPTASLTAVPASTTRGHQVSASARVASRGCTRR